MLSNEELFLMGNVEKLYEKNQPFMNFIAKKYASQDCLLGELEFDDCIGCGNIAFVKALKSFNPDKCKWTTYFSKIMINEILMSKRKEKNIRSISLDSSVIINGEDSDILLKDLLYSADDVEEKAINSVTCSEILEIVKGLPERKRKIVHLSIAGETQRNIAKKLNLSQSYVARIKKVTYRKLKMAYITKSQTLN
ncbi:MAG: sigma-70 family RNA polymerase sigma factor [Clostridiales bacterium]|nr:sigma-70 family RNA polymerase sigma factor [Clostridiales bacterium]